ncbi:NRPS-like enzyme protein [Rutstroemia sp. NJR-2017a BVV2]|nr:NRPS-like enzyme protein [Rutstroemia sp. NJR-2017a BVV2]
MATQKGLLPNLVDAIAAKEPEAIFAEYPAHPTSYESGYQKVSYGTFANAINGIAWWLQEKLGHGEDFPSLAYIGPNDILVNAFVLGAIKTGYKTLLTSPRNSIRAQENLFAFASCKTLITTSPQPVQLQPMIAALSSMGIQVLELPNISEIAEKSHPHFPFEKTFETARNDPIIVLHTSGTTELPKPIIWTHDVCVAAVSDLEPPAGYFNQASLYAGVRLFNTLPYFHAAGVYLGLLNAVYHRSVVIYPIAGFPSASLLIDGLKRTEADIAVLVPPYAIDIAQNADNLDFLAKNLKRLMYCGGAIPPAAGDVISSKIEFLGHVGATETGFYPSLKRIDKASNFWRHYRYNPSANISFEHQTDDLYEAVWHKNSDPETVQQVFRIFPNLQTWNTKDLYSPHPTEADLWLYRGRGDDIIVFLTGEKTNPLSMEQRLNQHPEIRQTMVIGTLRFQAALLIELVDQNKLSATERAEAIERIWPVIEEANATCPAHARVAKSHILFTEPGRPIPMSAKGTIQRSPALREYSSEIEKLYADADTMSRYAEEEHIGKEESVDTRDFKAVREVLRKVLCKVTEWDETKIKDDDNLFVQGMDSLQALQFIRHLRTAVNKPDLPITILYTNPSVTQLAKSIVEMFNRESSSKFDTAADRSHKIEETLQQYHKLVDKIPVQSDHAADPSPASEHVVVLTGSTGSLGSCILRTLMQTASVSHIYCLDRTSDSHSRHLKKNQQDNKPIDFPASKVTFLKADFSQPGLGLDDEKQKAIRDSATDIIHSAWPVNFNISLDTFEPHLQGIINLLSFVSTARQHISLLFISSISSISSLESTVVPEKIIKDTSAPLPMGYAESKFIAENILDYASKQEKLKNVDLKVARVGQIAGPAYTSGVWNKSEWMPSMVVTSFHMGFIPSDLGSEKMKLDWVPIDILSSSLVDISFNKVPDSNIRVFHPVNQSPTTWATLLPAILKTLNASSPKDHPAVTPIPYGTWLQKLRETARENALSKSMELQEILAKYPAIKLLDFFETLPGTAWADKDVTETLNASEHLANLKGIEAEWMEKWVKGWI